MAQFGAGPQFAAQCPRARSPDGWRPWIPDLDGPVPPPLAARATALAGDGATPLGATESFPLPGVTALLRVEARAWLRGADGSLTEGCFRVGGVYLPADSPPAGPPRSRDGGGSWTRTVAILTAVSLGVSLLATLSSWAFSKVSKDRRGL
jgi:hypothetical protein